ncbi:MAG: CaiB/BaiF CoA transferase family protein [Promethearchaeota archaeon]
MSQKNNLPLDGITILDLSRLLPGPYCSMILADMGAEVIRVEDPRYRYADLPPFYKKDDYSESALNTVVMRNKKSITLNLKLEESRQIFYDLVKDADILLEGFRPKVTERLGIDYQTIKKINPGIIYCSITGYGQTGPYSQLPGHDINYIGISGNLLLNRIRSKEGDSKEQLPVIPAIQTADIGSSFYSALGILGAIIERSKNTNHEGQYIDVSMMDSAFAFNPWEAATAFCNSGEYIDMVHGDYPNYIVYRTKDDKFLSIGNIETKFWKVFCETIGISEFIPKPYAEGSEKEEIFEKIQEIMASKTQQEWLTIFKGKETCVMPVNSYKEAIKDPQVLAREMVVDMNHPKFGTIKNLANPIKYSRTPLKIRRLAPQMGENIDEILKNIGYSDEKIRNLREHKCFGDF